MLSNGSNFITSFKATNDVQVALITGSVGSLFQEAFAGLGPNNNNPAFITNFIGVTANGTGNGSFGRIECFQSSSSSMALQFDFAVPLTSSDRILIVDADLSEKYGVQAYFAGQPLDLSGWSYAGYSGEESRLPDATWPVWSVNTTQGTLTASSSGLSEPLSVLAPNQSVDRVIITRFAQGSGSICIQFMNLTASAAGPPVLQIQSLGGKAVLSWSESFPNYSLYSTTNLGSPASWTAVGTQPSLSSSQLVITNSPSARAQFYRLQLQ